MSILKLLQKPIGAIVEAFSAQKIAAQAMRVKVQRVIPPLSDKTTAILVPKVLENTFKQVELRLKAEVLYFDAHPNEEQIQKIMSHVDVICFLSYQAHKSTPQKNLIPVLFKNDKPFIAMILGNTLDEELFPNADLMITTHSPTIHSMEAAFQYL